MGKRKGPVKSPSPARNSLIAAAYYGLVGASSPPEASRIPPATAAAPNRPINQPDAPPEAATGAGAGVGGGVGAGGGVYTGSGAGVYTGSGAGGVYTGSGAGVYTGSGAGASITGFAIRGLAAALRFITFFLAFAFIFFFFGIYTGFDASAITITGTDTTDNAARAAISRVDFIISGRTIYLSLLSTRIGESMRFTII
jgi:hypothetical protein